MNAVVICEEYDWARNANALLSRASKRADVTTHWCVRPCRLEDLRNSPALAREALPDAWDAHLMVLALGGKAELPPELLNWLEAWAAHRQVQDAALVVFNGAGGDVLSARATSTLSEFAERHGLDLKFDDIAPEEDESAKIWEELHEREVAQTLTLTQILEHAASGSYQYWDNNE